MRARRKTELNKYRQVLNCYQVCMAALDLMLLLWLRLDSVILITVSAGSIWTP